MNSEKFNDALTSIEPLVQSVLRSIQTSKELRVQSSPFLEKAGRLRDEAAKLDATDSSRADNLRVQADEAEQECDRLQRQAWLQKAETVNLFARLREKVKDVRSFSPDPGAEILKRLKELVEIRGDDEDAIYDASLKVIELVDPLREMFPLEKGKPVDEDESKDSEGLLKGKEAVSYKTAAHYLAVSDRQIRKLVAQGKLTTVGGGQHKKITVDSLRRYKGSSNPPAHD